MDSVIEIVEEYGLQNITTRKLDAADLEKKVFLAVMQKIGQPVEDADCSICIKNALDELKRFYKMEKAKGKKGSKKYRLKEGFCMVFDGIQHSNKTLTDDIAEKALEQCPGKIDFFEIVPKK